MSKAVIINLSDLKSDLAQTAFVNSLLDRAVTYLKAGYPVHFSGPSGAGKTTLALAVASILGRPAILVYGNEEFTPSDLTGGPSGFRKRLLYDNFIHSVYKSEEEFQISWLEGSITTACREGYTLIYDEFNRSRPETNNILLSVFEEGILSLQGLHKGEQCVRVHENFRAILTSNPEEYAGVYRTQDALMQRLITLYLDLYDRETEIAIGVLKSGLTKESVARVVDLVRALRQRIGKPGPSVRSIIRICRLAAYAGAPIDGRSPTFVQICQDVLSFDLMRLAGYANGREPAVQAVRAAVSNILSEGVYNG